MAMARSSTDLPRMQNQSRARAPLERSLNLVSQVFERASNDPYFSHPLEVAAILTDLKLDDATIAAALLHDTIEDTAATRAEIDQMFGKDIGALVEGLTKLKKLNLVTKEAKQAENLRRLLLAIADDVRVLLVKLADRLHNMRTISHMPPET